MDKALMVLGGKEILVSALEVSLDGHGNMPRTVSFKCPICRQPLYPAAMSFDSRQSAHFRHERNNPRAQECELFASNNGYLSTYERAPMPMFIRNSRIHNWDFIIEAGFRPLKGGYLSRLENDGAYIKTGQKNIWLINKDLMVD